MTRSLHPRTVAAINKALALGLDSLRAEVPQCLSDWAAEHFKLAGESSHQKGAWEGWPFQIGMLDFMSDDRIEELYVMKSKRVGYTKMVTAYVCYNIAHRRRKQALWQPTDDDRDSYVKSEIDPVLDQVEAVKKARRQGKGGTARSGHLRLAGLAPFWRPVDAAARSRGGSARLQRATTFESARLACP